MKRKLAIFGIILIFLAGIGVMSYPLISSFINNAASRSQVKEYTETTKLMTSEETLKYIEEAQAYNKSLTNNVVITDPFDYEEYQKIGANYNNALNIDGNGLIGYIDVPKINVYLPIYHGTSSEILEKGAGHLQNTSLPVGGESSHAIISAHTAFPGETFFDYLTDMEEGDEFYIHILDRTLKYEVNSIKVILPEETDDLRIVRGEDYVTLLTCTPYSVNTHRLLVRGTRVEYDDAEYVTSGASLAAFTEDYIFILGYKISYWVMGAIIGGVVLFVIIMVIVLSKKSKKKKAKHIKSDEKDSSSDDKAEDGE